MKFDKPPQLNENTEYSSKPVVEYSAPKDHAASVIKSPGISPEDEEKIRQIREKLGLVETAPLTLLEGISINDFDAAQLEIVRAFYRNRETRATIVNPDLHLRNMDRAITKVGKLVRGVIGKSLLTQNIEVQKGANLETRDDFSLDYFDVQHEVQPVLSSIEKSVVAVVPTLTEKQQELRVVIEKKDVKTFIKKLFIDGQNVSTEEVPLESNTLWQALKKVKIQIVLNRGNNQITHDGGGGGESVGTWSKVEGNLTDASASLETLSSLVTHEYTHVHQSAVAPKSYEGAEHASRTFRGHATHPTEIQARVHEAITRARKQQITFSSALDSIMNDYITSNKDRIVKEGDTTDSIKILVTQLHADFFEKHYSEAKNLYPYL